MITEEMKVMIVEAMASTRLSIAEIILSIDNGSNEDPKLAAKIGEFYEAYQDLNDFMVFTYGPVPSDTAHRLLSVYFLKVGAIIAH